MGKKYVIELCDKPMKNENGGDIWRVKGFNTLVFDQNGLDRLEEYKKPTTHIFEVGDVCKFASSDANLIITNIDPDYVIYMWDDGSNHGMVRRSDFEFQALFVRHSEEFCSFFKGGLK